MKNFMTFLMMFIFGTVLAQDDKQNINQTEETVTTKTTVITDDGAKTISKKAKIKARKNLELKKPQRKRVNYELKDKPYKVTVLTSYTLDGDSYNFQPDKKGFTVTKENRNNKMKPYARARRSETNKGYYILSSKNNKNSGYGTFDDEGNFIVESYNPEKDELEIEIYRKDQK